MQLRPVTRRGVMLAIEEYEQLGKHAFLSRYEYGAATRYYLVYNDRKYDSKAIVGAAYNHDNPKCGLLRRTDLKLNGGVGKNRTATVLRDLGFDVWDSKAGCYLQS